MQIKLFTIPVGDSGTAQEEMNRFLRGNKILEVQNQLISNENGAYWCFCVRYIEKAFVPTDEHKGKVDYKQILDEATFKKLRRYAENLISGVWTQQEYQDHVLPLIAFTEHAEAKEFRKKIIATF
ncbi:MAG: hypothetical protein ACREOI_18365 [bacterium]